MYFSNTCLYLRSSVPKLLRVSKIQISAPELRVERRLVAQPLVLRRA